MIIYKITNKINDKIYVGQTILPLSDRWSDHTRPHRGKNKARSAIALAIKKYGKENFSIEIIAYGTSLENLNALEKQYIIEFSCLAPNGYNLSPGGDNKECHPDTKAKIAATLKGRPIKNRQNGAKPGRPCTWGDKISKSMTGVAQPWKYKKVVANETGIVYESVNAAARELNVDRVTISGLIKSGKVGRLGLSFKFFKESA